MTLHIEKDWNVIKGKTIASARPLTKAERDSLGWGQDEMPDALVVIFDDGTGFIPMADPDWVHSDALGGQK